MLSDIAARYGNMLRQVFGRRVLGPEQPSIGKIQQWYIRQLMLKIETTASMKRVKEILQQIYESSLSDARMKAAQIYYDVDPY